MKKILFAIVLVITLSVAANAQTDGFFKWNGNNEDEIYRDSESLNFTLPSAHGTGLDYDAPLGSGLLVLTALGAGYATVRKRRRVTTGR